MQQKELAALLDISPAMVSRLAKRGMPTDTLERAQRWRRRHLEPGRVKGVRYERTKAASGRVAKIARADLPLPPASPPDSDIDAEALGDAIDAALAAGNTYAAAIRTWQLRELLRSSSVQSGPLLSVRTWLQLLNHMVAPDAPVRTDSNSSGPVSAAEFGSLFNPGAPFSSAMIWAEACDFHDFALSCAADAEHDD